MDAHETGTDEIVEVIVDGSNTYTVLVFLCYKVLDKHRQELHEFATGQGEQKPDWLPPNVQKEDLEDVRLYLLCGEDLLQSFSVPNLWAKDDVSETGARKSFFLVLT